MPFYYSSGFYRLCSFSVATWIRRSYACIALSPAVSAQCSGFSARGSSFRTRLSSPLRRRHYSRSYDTPSDNHTLLVIQPENKTGRIEHPYVPAERKLDEAVSLVKAISGWSVHSQRVDAVRTPHSKTFFGKGKMAELKQFAGNLPVTGIYLNVPRLTSTQHRTLERAFKKTVFDRFGIVLRIFKERARTKEAKLQVELAEIPYVRAQLAELEMASGGRRRNSSDILTKRKREVAIQQELKSIRERRQVMSEQRKRHHLPVVAVVGYTNAGKTTLIKALSRDESMTPEDMLFATLDTTVHAGKLPCGQKILYVDTIGFISDLPHELVQSFSSTLDDVTHADVLLHVRDMSHPQSYAQRADVVKVLGQLNLSPGLVEEMIEVGNKANCVDGGVSEDLVPISALHGVGLEELLAKLECAVIERTQRAFWNILLPTYGPELSWLHSEPEATLCDVSPITTNRPHPQDDDPLDVTADDMHKYLSVKVLLTPTARSKFLARFRHSVRILKCN